MPRTGRPRIIKISPEVFEGMCRVQCSEIEVAVILGCSIETLKRWVRKTYHKSFVQVYAAHAQVGKLSLRRAQFKLATEQNNAQMLIFLGKNLLNQRDKHEVAVEITDKRELGKSMLDKLLTQGISETEAIEQLVALGVDREDLTDLVNTAGVIQA